MFDVFEMKFVKSFELAFKTLSGTEMADSWFLPIFLLTSLLHILILIRQESHLLQFQKIIHCPLLSEP